MSTPLDAPITQAPAKPTPFTAARAGSRIRITGKGFPVPVEADVTAMLPEAGPRRVPGLIVTLEDGTDRLILQEGIQIDVLSDPSTLFTGFVPDAAVAARRRPTDIVAVQFLGDALGAVDIIKWCAGKIVVQHHAGEGDIPARLVFTIGPENTVEAIPGDWVYLENDAIKVAKPEDFAQEIEVLK